MGHARAGPAAEAAGYSLRPLYEAIPEPLRGYVELVYDTNNAPSIRFLEGLLYKSRYYNPGAQSVAISLVEKDDRPFVFSTPRLPEDEQLHARLPFHRRVDASRMRTTATTGSVDLLGLTGRRSSASRVLHGPTLSRPTVGGDGATR